MKKSIYLIVLIVALTLIVVGCTTSVVPPTEQTSGPIKGAFGSTVYVDVNNILGPWDGSSSNPFSTIQAAINDLATISGDTILVAAGTYIDDENGDGDDQDASEGGLVADICKSNLTLRSTDGPEVTIIKSRGTEGDGAVRIRGADDGTPTTGVTVDGFTVYNTGEANSGAGILIGCWFAGDMGHPANDNTVKNCIIGSSTDPSLSPTNGVYLWNTTGNIIQGNIIYKARNKPVGFGCGIMVWGGWDQNAPSSNNQIIDNEIYDSDRYGIFIGGFPQLNYGNHTISGNTITGSSGAPGIGLWNILGCDTITINFNNIYDNVYGISASGCDATVDATCNWWGDVSGPSHLTNPLGTGDAVSNEVDFDPWLLGAVPDAVCLDYDWFGFGQIVECMLSAKNHGQFVSCVAHLTNSWLKQGLILSVEKGAIMNWAAKSDIGKK